MAGRKVFTSGEILTSADVNSFLMDQSVMVFADSSARSSAIPSPSEGMVTYVEDANRVEVYDGSSFGPIGGILQVVSTTKTDTFSTASTSMLDITGLSLAITPSSNSSKILVMAMVPVGLTAVNQIVQLTLADGSGNNLIAPTSPGSRTLSYMGDQYPQTTNMSSSTLVLLHEPATTSAFTYKIRMRVTGATGTVNRGGRDADSALDSRGVSTLTLMEVAG